jgi:[acyl-carrier-protein] S-malonyltransferase
MRAFVAAVRPDLLEAAIELVGEDPFPRVEQSTSFAQPAILCASLAGWTRLREHVDPVALAGHSLGEFSALAAAGALSDHDALRLVVLRGDHMACSGEACGEEAQAEGLRALPLGVAGAFHCDQMQGAVAPLRAALTEVVFSAPRFPVISCASAAPFHDPAVQLAEALVSPVRWRDTMTALDAMGVRTYVDAGPGRVLAKLAAVCIEGASAITAETLLEDIHAFV